MKTMKLLFVIFTLAMFQMNANPIEDFEGKTSSDSLMCFNFYEEVDFNAEIEEFYIDELESTAFYIPMLNSEDLLLATKEDGVLKPVIFVVNKGNKIILKDINNRKETNILGLNKLENNFEISNSKYFKKNDSKSGLSLSVGCMGGSTAGCIELAVTSCLQDPVCAFSCVRVWKSCLGAIVLACAIHCNL